MMRSCEDIQLLLAEYAINALDEADAGVVRAHLAACAECRAELKRELRLHDLLGGLPVRECPTAEFRTSAPPTPLRPPTSSRRFAFAAGLAAALLVAVLAWQGVPSFEKTDGTRPARVAADTAQSAGFSPDEITEAESQLRYSLSLTARILQRGQRETMRNVFGERIPGVISDSLRKTIHTNQGDQG